MASLVNFAQSGVLGATMSLLLNRNLLNEEGLNDLSKLSKKFFEKEAHTKTVGRKDFVAFVMKKQEAGEKLTLIETIQTTFFQSLQLKEIPAYHEKTLKGAVPGTLQYIENNLPDLKFSKEEEPFVKEWLARFFEAYMSEETIEKSYAARNSKGAVAANDERGNVGNEMVGYAQSGKFTEADFHAMMNALVEANKSLEEAPNKVEATSIAAGYLKYLSKVDKESEIDLIQKLNNFFLPRLQTMIEESEEKKKQAQQV